MKYTFDKNRPLSWSSISSFLWNKEEWFDKYILKKPQMVSVEMEFGKVFAESIENDTCAVPELMKFLTGKHEHPFNVMFGNIPLVGYADDFDPISCRRLEEVKTGKREWNQKRVEDHQQIDMYLLMNYITNKIKPEDVGCRLHWLPTEQHGDFSVSFVEPVRVHTFKTKRTMRQVLAFGMKINKIYKEMQNFTENHP